VVAKSDRATVLDEASVQTLSMEQIEALKRDGTDAGKDLIAKLMLSHTTIDQKTEYSLAKYKLLKTKKYIRRFCVLPLDVPMLDYWLLEEKDPVKILDMREEMVALLGCWANVHFSGEDRCENTSQRQEEGEEATVGPTNTDEPQGRWLVVDDTGGLLVAAMAERMGILYPSEKNGSLESYLDAQSPKKQQKASINRPKAAKSESEAKTEPDVVSQPSQDVPAEEADVTEELPGSESKHQATEEEIPAEMTETALTTAADGQGTAAYRKARQYPMGTDASRRRDDLYVPYAAANTLTLVHPNSQPNLSFLRYYDFDITNPAHPLSHPLATHLMTLSWLQLLDPAADTAYTAEPPAVSAEELRTWKTNRRGNYHRKRRRWARVRHVVDAARGGGFAGLVVATTIDPVSVMRHAVPLLAGGASIAIYSQSVEPLAALVDCYSVARRAAWVANPPPEAAGRSPEELERWEGTPEFPLNPTLVLGAALQTSRVRRWQVLPGRTHPLMTSKGGAEGYIFTAWRVKPAEGKVEARGKGRQAKKRKVGE
jgi:tRNA (adenine58-N1)-methyltransferase non-catalytic subunit